MAQQRRRHWPVLAVNATVAGTVLVLVAVLALVVRPPTPPGIAAFAPQAAKPITKAPLAQSAEFGEGAGQCGRNQVCAVRTSTPAAAPAPTAAAAARRGGVPSALQCYTWPDGTVTQTFDPQSPPCIATWNDAVGNGGSTSPGVSATEIRVALPTTDGVYKTWPGLKPIVDFVNSHFQLYGRKIRIVPFFSQQAKGQEGAITINDPAMQRADAAQITQLKVFATTDFIDPVPYSWSLPVFRDVLTKHKIISLAGGQNAPYGAAADLARNAPYEWTYYSTIDALMTNVATMTCRQLVGRPAQHSQDPALAAKTRKFAVYMPSDRMLGGPAPGLASMLRVLDGCGVHSPKVAQYDVVDGGAAQTTQLNQMKVDGVTSLLYFPFTGNGQATPMFSAAQVNYSPEWVTIGWNKHLTDIQTGQPESETKGTFGVGNWNKMPPLQLEHWYQSYLAAGGDPGVVTSGYLSDGRAFYNELLMLASGIQMAGPRLTPQSFAQGLLGTTFPNPGAGAPPFYQGTVGFTAADVAMVKDYNGFWLDTRTNGNQIVYVDSNQGLNTHRANCYVALGRRWSLDTWPSTDGFYGTQPCR